MRQASLADRPVLFGAVLLTLGAAVSAWFALYREPSADEGAILTAAVKILGGGIFYHQIDAYPFPGAHYLLAGAMHLFGEHLTVARTLAAGIWCTTLLALYAVALQVVSARRAALFGLALLAYKFLAWPSFTLYAYWDVAFACGCVSIAFFLGRRPGVSWRLLTAGLFAGLALVSKQNLGIYLAAAMGALILLPRWLLGRPRSEHPFREATAFAGTALLPFLAFGAYFALHDRLGQMLASGLVRPFTAYLPTSGVSFLEPLRWWELGKLGAATMFNPYFVEPLWTLLLKGTIPDPGLRQALTLGGEVLSRLVYTSIPVAFAIATLVRRRAGATASPEDGRFVALGWLCLAVVLSAFPRADFAHVISVHPLVLPLLLAGVERLERSSPGRWRSLVRWSEAGGVALVLLATGTLAALNHAQHTRHVVLDRAELWVTEDSWLESVVRYVREEVSARERFFVYGADAQYYFLTGRFYPWPFSQLYPGQAGEDDGRALAYLLRRAPPVLALRGVVSWPGLPAISRYASQLDRHMKDNFRRDLRVFERHPIPGHEPPPFWVLTLLRPCEQPVEECESFGRFLESDPEASPFRDVAPPPSAGSEPEPLP